jgi:hypothetical protein
MATKSGTGKTRENIKIQTMRELMFASGGRCAMTDCGLPLTSLTGGWIGTVAHIVGAEVNGPRGKSSLTPKERAEFGNLMLMCATHGREVDAPETGEANFSVERLRHMKEEHEAKVTEAITAAIEEDRSGIKTATGAIDTGLRAATAATTAEGLLESLGLKGDSAAVPIAVDSLNVIREDLQRLSQVALDTLSQLLHLWLRECPNYSVGWRDFGDPSLTIDPSLPLSNVDNRIKNSDVFSNGLSELKARALISVEIDEYEETSAYAIRDQWRLKTNTHWYNFWISAAYFLQQGYGVEIQDWVKGLDFSIFDRPAPVSATVEWRG